MEIIRIDLEMPDNTYIELNQNNKSTVQLNIYRQSTGEPFSPSGAYVEIRGAEKDNIVVAKKPASVSNNQVWTTITQTVTASAAEYLLEWEIHRFDGDITNHYTKVLVIENF